MDRLFFKYLAPLLAISIIPTLAIVLILNFFIRNNLNEMENNLIHQETETLTRLVSEKNEAIVKSEGMFIEHEVDKIRQRLKTMQLAPGFINLDADNINAFSENLFAQESSIMEMTVADNFGNIIFQKYSSLSLETDEPTNIKSETIFRQLEKKQPYLSPVEVSNTTQMPYITLAQPILSNAGALAGGIIVKLDLSFIRDLVAEKKVGDTGFFYIISSRGRLIAHPSVRELFQNSDYTKYDYINEVLSKKNGTVWKQDYLISFFTNKYDWITIVEVPAHEALATVEQNKRTILSFINATLQSIAWFTVMIIILGFTLAIFATIFITGRMLKPIINFTNATRRISEGELSLKIEKISNDELGELTDSFNKMAEELKKEREELIQNNEAIREQTQQIIARYLSTKEATDVNFAELEKPLLRVKNFLTEMQKRGKPETATEPVQEVIADIDQIDGFLKDLFEFSKISTNISTLPPVNFSTAYMAALERLDPEIKKNNAIIRCGAMPVTKAIRASIIQLFENLIGNALKYHSDMTPEIFISAEDKGSEWLFAVRDNGIGIDAELLNEIFHVREQKLNGHFKFNFGLALCKNIVERHGGNIWVESKKGAGSVFYFTIKKF